MKKKLLALAVAGAFAAPVAMADTGNVAIYGTMDVSYDSTSTGSPAVGGNSVSTSKVSSNVSILGFKGTEDLGGGTSAIFQLENGINADNQLAGTWNNRNTFVGLSGDSWGSIKLGNLDSPYKSSTRGMDLFGNSIADNRSIMGGVAGVSSAVAFDGRSANSMTYSSPDMSGFKIAAQYTAGAELATVQGSNKGSAWSLAGTYGAGPITAALAYETHDFGDAGTGTLGAATGGVTNKKESAFKLGVGYGVEQFAVNLVYEKTQDAFRADGTDLYDHRSVYVAGKYNISGMDAVKMAYTKVGNVGNTNAVAQNTGAKQISLGYDHGLSKRTTVYALWTKLTNDTAGVYGLTNGASSTGSIANVGADADPAAVSIGLRHTF